MSAEQLLGASGSTPCVKRTLCAFRERGGNKRLCASGSTPPGSPVRRFIRPGARNASVVLQRVPPTLRPGLLELVEPEPEPGFEGFIARLNETDEEFAARQKSGWENFKAFQAALTPAQARIMVEDIGTAAIEAMIVVSPDDARALAKTLLTVDRRKRNRVANFAMRLAKGLSAVDAGLARTLFEAMAGETGYVRLTFGPAALSLESLAIWGSAPSVEIDAIKSARLDNATSDDLLDREVLAALTADQGAFIESYVRRKLQSRVPADQARALMVLAFGLETSLADHELAKPMIDEGLISMARGAARYGSKRWQQRRRPRSTGGTASCLKRSWMGGSSSGRRT